MKKQLAVLLLMLCTIAAQAQLMGPGYILGNQRVPMYDPKQVYPALYEAADRNDCATFKGWLDTGVDPNLTVELPGKPIVATWYIRDYVDGYLRFERFILSTEKPTLVRIPEYYYLWKVAREAAAQGHLCILQELNAHGFDWKHPYFHRPNVSLEDEDEWISLEDQRERLLLAAVKNKQIEVVNFLVSLPEFQNPTTWFFESTLRKANELLQAEAAKAQQKVVQREVKASLPKKK